jgi:putative ABC transport system ATP-binding protein
VTGEQNNSDGPRIRLDGVAKRYQVGDVTVTALEDVTLEVDAAALVVILGPSGSGKTTLLNLIGALDTPTEGQVETSGRDITHADRKDRFEIRRRAVSFVFQSFNLFPGLTAVENVAFVGLGDRLEHFPHQLSGGEQQRVAIARALATRNPVLLADEPTGELDFQTGVQILELLRAQAEAGKTVMVVTHNREISRVADRVIELSSGRVVSDGPPQDGRADIAELRW